MEYFELILDKKVENPVEVMNLDPKVYRYDMNLEYFNALDTLKVAYYSGREMEELCGLFVQPAFLISDDIKRLFVLYEKESRFKAVQLFSTAPENKLAPLYWVPWFPELDCTSKTKKYTTGTVEELILDERVIRGRNIFKVAGLLEYKVIVSFPVAESLLRRRFYGVGFQKVKVM